jgi:hypothetical protein
LDRRLKTGRLRIRFGTKREEITIKWRKMQNEELHNFSSPDIIRVIKSRINKMDWSKQTHTYI